MCRSKDSRNFVEKEKHREKCDEKMKLHDRPACNNNNNSYANYNANDQMG